MLFSRETGSKLDQIILSHVFFTTLESSRAQRNDNDINIKDVCLLKSTLLKTTHLIRTGNQCDDDNDVIVGRKQIKEDAVKLKR